MSRSRPRVLVLSPDFPPAKGGIQLLCHRVISSFTRLEPTVVTVGQPAHAAFDAEQDFNVVRTPRGHGSRSAAILGLNGSAVGLALRLRPDVVLSMHIVTSPAAALIHHGRDVPFVQYVYARELGARPELARFALTRANRVVAISGYARALAMAGGAQPERITLVSPGVDLPPKPQMRRDNTRPPTFITISRLEDAYKGHDVVLRALSLVRAQLPDVQWRIVGEGRLRASLEAAVRAQGLGDAVQFLGALSDTARDEQLRTSDAFCMVSRLPSGGRGGEGFGIVYLEANAHGLPVIAGNVGGATDAVVQGETGLLVNPEDPRAVADALLALLSDRELATRLGTAGRDRAESLTWATVAHRLEAELLSLLA